MIATLVKALIGDVKPWQLSAGLALGLLLGLMPWNNLLAVCILLIVCMIRVNIITFALALAATKAIAGTFEAQLLALGDSLLLNEAYKPLWDSLYSKDWARLMHYNHNLTLGSFVAGAIAAVPIFFVGLVVFRFLPFSSSSRH